MWKCVIECHVSSVPGISHAVKVESDSNTPDTALMVALDEWDRRSAK